jgi:ketosteroid isomerase-like protein
MKGINKFDIEVVDSVDVKVLEPDVTLYSFRYKATVIDAKGDTMNMNSVISGVAERKGGEWKVVHSHETTSSR